MTTIADVIKENIRIHMSKKLYMEGKNKDYYFGTSKLNDALTVFYNDIGEETKLLRDIVRDSVEYAFADFQSEYGFYKQTSKSLSLQYSALCIPVYSYIIYWKKDDEKYAYWKKDDEKYACRVNYMQSGVLEDSMKNNPERWEIFEKYKEEIFA